MHPAMGGLFGIPHFDGLRKEHLAVPAWEVGLPQTLCAPAQLHKKKVPYPKHLRFHKPTSQQVAFFHTLLIGFLNSNEDRRWKIIQKNSWVALWGRKKGFVLCSFHLPRHVEDRNATSGCGNKILLVDEVNIDTWNPQ